MITNEIVNHAIEYIMNHIEEDISIEDVADYCHFSKYYFSRVFKEETGESIYSFIKKVRLEQSAFRLKVDKNKTITDIGYEYGYSPSNYSSAFRKQHDTSPAEFRKEIFNSSMQHPLFQNNAHKFESFEECNKKVTIEILDDQFVLYERHIGRYHDLGNDWCEFQERYRNYITEDTIFYERTFDDPSITDPTKCLYDICMSIDKDCTLENTYMLQGGKFAVYHFQGYPAEIYAAYQTMFNIWFPNSRYNIDKRYGFDRYRKIDYNSLYMTIDLCLPAI